MNDTTLFRFEGDFVDTLRCIPMAVRFKLDACGIKLTLRQWSGLDRAGRQRLLQAPAGDAAEVAAYRELLRELVAAEDEPDLAPIPVEAEPAWRAPTPPTEVRSFARESGLPPISEPAWRALTPLQRFTLVKLTRPGHDNENFAPALAEFGLR